MFMVLPDDIRRQFQAFGREGGRARARRIPAAERTAIARSAALRRWTEKRFGNSSFDALGLPGGDRVDRGLEDLAWGRETAESLMLSLAAPRLRREGVPLPVTLLAEADIRLYRLLERQDGDLAHARYLSRLRQIASFADACRLVRADRGSDA
jgi:hypothetical protein